MRDFFAGKITLYRRLAQILTLCFFFVVYYSSHRQSLLLGSLYSFKIGPLHIVDPFIYLTYLGRNLGKADFYLWTIAGFFIPLIVAFFLGRIFCSWICPYNFLYEIADYFKSLFIRRKNLSYFETSLKVKAGWLGVAFFLSLLWPALPYYLLLPGLLSVFLHQLTLHFFNFAYFTLFWVALILLFDLMVQKRIWCKFLCPTGIILELVRFPKGLRIIKDEALLCKECALCSFECPLGLTPHLGNHWKDCYNCGRCVDTCKSLRKKDNPLRFKFL